MPNHCSSFRLSALAACVVLALLVPWSSSADTLTLAWDANPEAEVSGYYVFIGSESGSYSSVIDVGNATSYTITGATPGATYFLTVAAYAPGPVVGTQAPELVASVAAPPGGNPGSTNGTGGTADTTIPRSDAPPVMVSMALAPSRGHAAPADRTAPTLMLTSPTTSAAYASTGAFVTLSGWATDDVALESVTWTSDRGGSGDVAGTTTWSVVIPLQTGANVLTVTALDASANLTVVKLKVTFGLPPARVPARPTQRRRFARP
ncbi:MAG: fibronectin type III domain-containing protein [Vicinamibacterales bacterium]